MQLNYPECFLLRAEYFWTSCISCTSTPPRLSHQPSFVSHSDCHLSNMKEYSRTPSSSHMYLLLCLTHTHTQYILCNQYIFLIKVCLSKPSETFISRLSAYIKKLPRRSAAALMLPSDCILKMEELKTFPTARGYTELRWNQPLSYLCSPPPQTSDTRGIKDKADVRSPPKERVQTEATELQRPARVDATQLWWRESA